MDISTRPAVPPSAIKSHVASRSWHAQPRIRPRGASGRPSRALARENVVLCRISCQDGTCGFTRHIRTTGPKKQEKRKEKEMIKINKWEPLIITCYCSIWAQLKHKHPQMIKGFYRKLDFIAYVIPPRFPGPPRIHLPPRRRRFECARRGRQGQQLLSFVAYTFFFNLLGIGMTFPSETKKKNHVTFAHLESQKKNLR